MGWTVLAFGIIDVEEKYHKQVLQKLKALEKLENNLDVVGDDLSFEMHGNKFVSYDILDELKEWAIKNKISINIYTSEYDENGNGYYFDSKEVC